MQISLASPTTRRQKISHKTFPVEKFLETNKIFAIRGKKVLFHCVRANKQHTLCKKPYATK